MLQNQAVLEYHGCAEFAKTNDISGDIQTSLALSDNLVMKKRAAVKHRARRLEVKMMVAERSLCRKVSERVSCWIVLILVQ